MKGEAVKGASGTMVTAEPASMLGIREICGGEPAVWLGGRPITKVQYFRLRFFPDLENLTHPHENKGTSPKSFDRKGR
jgi:hypothetical protein